MYSISVRINAIFFFFGICCCILAAFNIGTTIFSQKPPIIKRFNFKSTTLYSNKYTRVQHSSGTMDLAIDFEPCFDWNTNLIFSWISATYKTGKYNTTVTIWDKIMLRSKPETHSINKAKEYLKYPLIDKKHGLLGKEVYLELHWEHMPVIGPILKFKKPLGNFNLLNHENIPGRRDIIREYDYSDDEPEE